MNQKLVEIYQNRFTEFKEITERFKDVNLHGPFLTSPKEQYQRSEIRLLIIGQETKGWFGINSEVNGLMKVYEDFNLGEIYYSSPFWNIIRKVERTLNLEPYSCAWTNLNKFDVNGKRPTGIYEKEISRLDDILLSEIEVLQPDICIFFTGPAFDYRLKKIYKNLIFQEEINWKHNQLVTLKHQKLPEFTIRTYHPKYLRLKKFENQFIDFLSKKKNTTHNRVDGSTRVN